MAEVANPAEVLPPAPEQEDTHEDDTQDVDTAESAPAGKQPKEQPATEATQQDDMPGIPKERSSVSAAGKLKPGNVFKQAPARAAVRTKNYPSRPQDDKRFSFTACPNSQTARPHARADFSHSNLEVLKITADNNKLCRRLMEISATPTGQFGASGAPPRRATAGVAPAAVNRRKNEDKIAQENLAIYKRLQAIKPSKDISRGTLGKEFQKSRGYLANARKLPAPDMSVSGANSRPAKTPTPAAAAAEPAAEAAPVADVAPSSGPPAAEPTAEAVDGESVPVTRPSAEAKVVQDAVKPAEPEPEPAPEPAAPAEDEVEDEMPDETE